MRLLATLVFLVLAAPSPGALCCMVPTSFKGTIGQTGQNALIIHHNGREELILGIDYRIGPPPGDPGMPAALPAVDANGKPIDVRPGPTGLPEKFVWVITVPSEPDRYQLGEPELFGELRDLTERLMAERLAGRSKGMQAEGAGGAPPGVQLGQRVRVGPYDIQPVRALGLAALEGLNTWLGANGFPTEPPAHMAYFVDHKFTFLCIKVSPPEGEKTVAVGGRLPPLHLSFVSQQPYYPLKFSSRQGLFDVNLWVISTRPLDARAVQNAEIYRKLNAGAPFMQPAPLGPNDVSPALAETLKKLSIPDAMSAGGPWYFSYIRGERVNKDNAISAWDRDIFLVTE
jgi:hypothetical protein